MNKQNTNQTVSAPETRKQYESWKQFNDEAAQWCKEARQTATDSQNVRKFKVGKYGLSESPLNQHVALNWRGRRLLGEVYDAQYNSTTGYIQLSVKHFNGSEWPIKPVASAVEVISKEAR